MLPNPRDEGVLHLPHCPALVGTSSSNSFSSTLIFQVLIGHYLRKYDDELDQILFAFYFIALKSPAV